ncbi:DHH family phosphoesterase [Shimazuella kribbensis]|uniref:DHH family phosphoesterase n=1 Tax=Shimazuella kribbensis TaxID=139808 RepID=UPI00048AB7FA|nr:DHH family phosphoesterase [Shimazuella kribbensis]
MPKFVIARWRGLILVCVVLWIAWTSYLWWKDSWLMMFLVAISFVILVTGIFIVESIFQRQFRCYSRNLVDQLDHSSELALTELPIGVFLYDQENKIVWHNSFIQDMFGDKDLIDQSVSDIFPTPETPAGSFSLIMGNRSYQFTHYTEHRLYMIQDVTPLATMHKRIELERTVLGFLQLDNYDEAGQGLSDQEEAELQANILNTITTWAKRYDIALKRIDTDKMFVVTNQQTLEELIQNRFDILDLVREQTRQHKIPITLSIGITNVGINMVDRSNHAQAALQVALARGGDQAAVQGKERVKFFGGKTNAMEKRTRVRARVISGSLGKLIDDSKQVLVMGHKDPDMDALGAAIGMLRFASLHDRPAFMVVDQPDMTTQRLMRELEQHVLGENLVTASEALEIIEEPGTLLILVDTNKPSFVVEPEVVKRAEKIVVIDHHRRGEDYVEDAVISYIEPYASSTCELVTELLQYQDDLTLDPLESTALLAGIVVDTKNFTARAGSRTFEAASFLRRHGADLFMVQSLLREDLTSLMNRSELLQHTKTVLGRYALVVGEEEKHYDQITIAQTADALVNLHGVEASFVIARRDEKMVAISARSAGKLNVQVIMEEMGGGGHLTNAACQLKGVSLEQAEVKLISHLEDMLNNEGET